MTALTVWCESGSCPVVRVYRHQDGTLVEKCFETIYGTDEDGGIRAQRYALWLEEFDDDDLDNSISFSCACDRTERHWTLRYPKIVDALQDGCHNIGVSG